MFTRETKIISAIRCADISNVQKNLFCWSFNYIEKCQISFFKLWSDLARLEFLIFCAENSCHMNEGIFGADIHRSEIEATLVHTWGILHDTINSGYHFLRSSSNAMSLSRPGDTTTFDIKKSKNLVEEWRKARNAIEHLDESIKEKWVTNNSELNISIKGLFIYKHKSKEGKIFEFDLKKEALENILILWEGVIRELHISEEIIAILRRQDSKNIQENS